ncbi:MAG: D-glycerate dehydrogenase [Alphaproteobacteria bacterium]|nr:D-glycerate dehydrogenase [Alphaproteobacteria bacterium]MBV9373413.1 D-glycerate dehydrogenase [Alphaproteobacteria bacterium]MBV9902541.1 D-glycerate dehydrogenase [Alphaproteobacteria bacterium]
MRLKVVVTRPLPAPVEAKMRALFDVELNADGAAFDRERLASAMQRCDALASNVGDRLDAGLIAGVGDRLRLIANFGVGTDNIDLAAARRRGIAVTNTPDVLTQDTADIVMALILITLRRLGEGERLLRDGRWGGWKPTDFLGRSLAGKTLGIVGMGRIGQAVARRAAAFGMDVHYHNRKPAAGHPARYWADLDAMIEIADVVSVNAPYGAETHHLVDGRRLARMKRDAVLINAARGAIVDEEALVAALAEGRIAGAGLDVYPHEPHVDPRLVAMEQVVLLPHMGSATVETRTAMGMKVVENILAFADGRELPDQVV